MKTQHYQFEKSTLRKEIERAKALSLKNGSAHDWYIVADSFGDVYTLSEREYYGAESLGVDLTGGYLYGIATGGYFSADENGRIQ